MLPWATAILACLGALTASCERITHADSFRTVAREPFQGACNACPATAEALAHPPCPPDVGDGDDGEIHAYVWRYYRIGFDEQTWLGPNAQDFWLGWDLDCSSRQPDGLPTSCQPRTLADGSLGEPWVPLPHGIDNAMSQRLLSPLYKAAAAMGQEANLEQGINDSIAQGGSSIMAVVEHWNGLDDDPKVTARIGSVAGISRINGGPPRWDGTDYWDALSDGPDPESALGAPNTTFVSHDAYVSGGVLVLDLSFLGVAPATLLNGGARLDLQFHDFLIVGTITPTEMPRVVVTGRWSYSDAVRAIPDIADYLSGCEPLKGAFVKQWLQRNMEVAPDVALLADADPSEPCGAISMAYGGEAVWARIGGYTPVSAIPVGCPSQ